MRAPAAESASRITSARSGRSVPGVGTPIQISAPGTCASVSSAHTTGSCSIANSSNPSSVGGRCVAQPRGLGDSDGNPSAANRYAAAMPRAADIGLRIGLLQPGPTASIVDVPGVGVGHATVWRDEPAPPDGRGAARTGVTVIDPGGNLFRAPIPAGGAVLNGAGECTGFIAMQE